MKVFISQPMNNRTMESIIDEREDAILALREMFGRDVDVIESIFDIKDDVKNPKVMCLSRSIRSMSIADLVVFIGAWEDKRGCEIEHTIAKKYGIPIMELPNNN